jgi:hypothetical protein
MFVSGIGLREPFDSHTPVPHILSFEERVSVIIADPVPAFVHQFGRYETPIFVEVALVPDGVHIQRSACLPGGIE